MIDAATTQNSVRPDYYETDIFPPYCPKCGAEMKKRLARKGKQAGKEFWGCVNYPRCTGTRSVEDTVA